MRLKQLDLIKYGKFDGESLVFEKSAQDFHVIVGPNEAGKSTVRNAVLELLFGMPMRTPLAFRHELSDLRLGGVLDSDKGEKVFHRARGKTPLRTPEDEKLPDDYLSGILGGASKEFFEQMFGLDHEKLVEGGRSILDASKDLGRVLFQSSSGIASLGPVRDALEARAGEIWAPRKSSSEYALAETRLSEAIAELKQTQVRTKVWADAKGGLDDIEDAIEHAKAKRLQLDTQRSMLERVRRLAPTVSELKNTESELAARGDAIDMPQSAYADLNKGFTELASAQRVLEERQRDLEARQREREELKTDDSVLEFSADIIALDEARGACVNHARDLLLRKAEVSRLLDEAHALAQQLAWPTDDAALCDYLPSALILKTALQLFNRHEPLLQAASHAREVATEKAQDIENLREQLSGLPTKDVPGDLRQALSDAQSMRLSRTRQLTLQNEILDAKMRLEEALLALGRWRRELEYLRGMDLPSAARVSDMARQLQTYDTAITNARDRLAEAQAKQEQLQLEQKHFTESYKVVTRTEVLEARADRDAAWNSVKTHAISIDAGAPVIDAAIRLADELADTELGTATDAAKLQSIKQQIEHVAADVERAQKSLSDQLQLHTQHRSDWDALMQSVGLPGMTVHDFPDWQAKREAVFTTQDNLRRLQREFDTEQEGCSEAEAALTTVLKNVGLDVSASIDLAALISIADNFVRSADAAAAQQEKLQQQMAQAEASLKNSKIKEEAATKAYEDWSAQWQHALAEAKLTSASATLAQAASAIEIAGTITGKLNAAEEIRRTRIQTMQADLDALEADTRRVCTVLDASLLALSDWPEVIL